MAVRRPSAGIHSYFFGLTITFFFGLTITQLSSVGAARGQRANEPFLHTNYQLGDIMKLSSLTFIAVTLCAGTVNWSISIARAHANAVQTQDVGDVDGHTMAVNRFSGLASFPDGSVDTINFTGTNDYTKGAGTNLTYWNLTLKDGSVLWYKLTGTAKIEGTTTIFPEAPISVLGGTGRFQGAKGDGTSTGARLTPLAVGAELYLDVVINVKK
jgi:hypothetical protein